MCQMPRAPSAGSSGAVWRPVVALSPMPRKLWGGAYTMTLDEWATRWGISAQALTELAALPLEPTVRVLAGDASESNVQARVRLHAASQGVHLWRNNSGAGSVVDPSKLCSRCAPLARSFIRWGLGNDSPNLNAVVKSADLIGWRPLVVTDGMVGHTVAQFVSRECKRQGWTYKGTPEETAQNRWHSMILAAGGDSAFTTGTETL